MTSRESREKRGKEGRGQRKGRERGREGGEGRKGKGREGEREGGGRGRKRGGRKERIVKETTILLCCSLTLSAVGWKTRPSTLASSCVREEVGVVKVPLTPPSGMFQSLTQQSSAPVARRSSWNGEKSKSVTKPKNQVTRSQSTESKVRNGSFAVHQQPH